MVDQLQRDAAEAPNGFDFLGPVPVERLERWAATHHLAIPHDLLDLWALTGGGDLFETEELFCPDARNDHDISPVNQRLRRQGLPPDLLVFHSGLTLTAAATSGALVELDPHTCAVRRAIASLDDWYTDLRSEYAETYGLSPL
jgi:hypothetical protein